MVLRHTKSESLEWAWPDLNLLFCFRADEFINTYYKFNYGVN